MTIFADKQIRFVVAPSGGGPPPSGDSPQWIADAIAAGWQVGRWARISGASPSFGLAATNTPRAVKTVNQSDGNFQDSLRTWNGGAAAPALGAHGSMLIGMGGAHSKGGLSYEGNDVFALDIDTRAWSQVRAATANYTSLSGNSFGEFPDGSPLPTHTYFQLAATGPLAGYPKGLLIMPRSVANVDDSTQDAATPYPHWLDLNNPAAGWVRGDPIPQSTRSGWRKAPAGYWDDVRQRYVLWATTDTGANNMVASLNPLAAPGSQWTVHSLPTSNGQHAASNNGIEQCVVRDRLRDLMLFLDWRTRDVVGYIRANDLTAYRANSPSSWVITELGTPPTKAEGVGLDWSVARGAAIVWSGSGNAGVHELKYASGSEGALGTAGNLTYQWTSLTAAGNTITPDSQGGNDAKVYNRFRIFSFADGVEIAVAVTTVDGPAFAFLLADGA